MSNFNQNFLVIYKRIQLPKDPKKLRISREYLLQMKVQMQLPLSFVSALAQQCLPIGRGFSSVNPNTESKAFQKDLWYILPVRIQYSCSDKRKGHVTSTSGNKQMNPFHHLHLPDAEVEIRGSHVAILSRHSVDQGRSVPLMFNFMDGRWSKSVEEPQRRILEASSYSRNFSPNRHHFTLHLVCFTTLIRWWTNA